MSGHRVALTGMGLVTPLGHDRDEVWKAVLAGRTATAPIRGFDASALSTRIAAEVPEMDLLAWVRLRTQRRSGRAAQYALAAAAMALADAGWSDDGAAAGDGETAAIVGSAYGSLPDVEQAYRVFYTEGWRKNPFLAVPMCMPNAPGSQISLEHGLGGPSFTVAAGCASGAIAVGNALQMVRSGQVRRAVAGGVDVTVLPGAFAAWCRLGVMSTRNHDPGGACAPFSADRDGLVLGDGACILTLERRADAVARGARIYAEVAGFGEDCEAGDDALPTEAAEAAAMGLALADAGLAAADVGYVSADAGGSRRGDAIEARAIRRVFAGRSPRPAVSATKSMLGHALGAAPAIECALAALALRDQRLPPTANLRARDPGCEIDVVTGASRATPVEAALVNAFARGGPCAVLVLRRHPEA